MDEAPPAHGEFFDETDSDPQDSDSAVKLEMQTVFYIVQNLSVDLCHKILPAKWS